MRCALKEEKERKFMEFNNAYFKKFRDDFNATVKELAEKYNVKIELGGISYGANDFTTKLTATRTDVNVEKENFERNCAAFGFKPEDYLKQFSDRGQMFELTGFNLKASVNKAQFRDVKTKSGYHGPISFVKGCMGEKASEPVSKIDSLKKRYLTDFRGNEIGDTIQEKFAHLECLLSPENLCCDGELSKPAVDKKYKELRQIWRALEMEFGRAVTTIEACEWGA
jgi:hypothetical protein